MKGSTDEQSEIPVGISNPASIATEFLQDYLGTPTGVEAAIIESETGVDLSVAAGLTFGDKMASMQSSITQLLPSSATLSGTFGIIHVPAFFHAARRFEIHTLDGDAAHPFSAEGETESDVMRPADTVETLHIIDAIRESARSRSTSDS